MRRVFLCSAIFVFTVSLSLACTTDYQKGTDDPNYGAPNALAGQTAPEPGGGPKAASSDQSGAKPLCVTKGGTPVTPDANCTVKFADVLAVFQQKAPGASAACTDAACHGGANPPLPKIDSTNAQATYDGFAAFPLSNGSPYINPCSTDPKASTISQNLYATGSVGTKMPLGAGQVAQTPDIDKIETWLKCGSPKP
jgi:hypothetical protein